MVLVQQHLVVHIQVICNDHVVVLEQLRLGR